MTLRLKTEAAGNWSTALAILVNRALGFHQVLARTNFVLGVRGATRKVNSNRLVRPAVNDSGGRQVAFLPKLLKYVSMTQSRWGSFIL